MSTHSPRGKIPAGLLVIGIMKLLTALLLAGTAFGAFKLLNKDVEDTLQQAIILMHLDPHNHYLNALLEKVSGLDHKHLKQLGIATMVYAGLYVLEGIGLLMGKHWAEYLVIIITGSLLPLEAFEIFEKPTGLRVGVLVINLAILAYLILRLKKDKQEAARKAAAGHNSTGDS